MIGRWPLALGLAVAAVACVARLGSPAAAHGQRAIAITNFAFAPPELIVSVGDTVVWTNDDVLPHTASADSGAWSSPELRRGERHRFVPTRAGRFPYHCSAHPVMRATLVVRP